MNFILTNVADGTNIQITASHFANDPLLVDSFRAVLHRLATGANNPTAQFAVEELAQFNEAYQPAVKK